MRSAKVLSIDYHRPDPAAVQEAAAVLTADGLVVAPTETSYGLLGRADRAGTLRKVFGVKKRRGSAPVAVFVKSVAALSRYAVVNNVADRLARRFLPGPLTLVLNAADAKQPYVTDEGKVGLRVSSAPMIAGIMDRVSFPVTATSANLSGDATPEAVSQLKAALGDTVDLYLDGGRLAGMPSTVVDCTGESPRILRPGAIASDEIAAALKGDIS